MLKNKIKSYIHDHKAFIMYGLISVFVTVIDVIVTWCAELILSHAWGSASGTVPVVSNTIGVVTGFIIQYFLTARHVYNVSSAKSFAIFLGTFFMNLLFANGIIYIFRTLIFENASTPMAFLVSKAASIVLPFFITYFVRKYFMPTGEEENRT